MNDFNDLIYYCVLGVGHIQPHAWAYTSHQNTNNHKIRVNTCILEHTIDKYTK